jgi:GTP cyclohydrolase II
VPGEADHPNSSSDLEHHASTATSTAIRMTVHIPVRASPDDPWRGADVVTFTGLVDDREHLAIVFSGWSGVPTVRLHSECLTGDVFGSARCDCGPQLHEAITLMQQRGGIILYLRQEGRGIGLYNKLDAYRLQDFGVDTFRANRELDFEEDLRDYKPAAQMLLALGVSTIRLLSNNPDKSEQLRVNGVDVIERVATGVFINDSNRRYLQAKVDIAGHQIRDVEGLT